MGGFLRLLASLARSYDRHLRRKEAEQKRTLKEQKQALKQVKKSLTTLEKTLPRPFDQNHQKLPVSKPKSADIVLPSTGDCTFEIVGESYYQDNLESIYGGRTTEGEERVVKATLVHEDSNPYDDKAIRVEIDGKTVGHLSREDARAYRDKLVKDNLKGATATCSANIVGGWDRGRRDKGYYAVRLDLSIYNEDIQGQKEFEFYLEGMNKESLKWSQVGNRVKFWQQPGTNKIRIYDLPAEPQIGYVPSRYCNLITKYINSEKYTYQAKITEINPDSGKIFCGLYSTEELEIKRKQEIQAESERRCKSPVLKEEEVAYFHSNKNFDVNPGDDLTLDLRDLTVGASVPNCLKVLNNNGEIIGEICDSYYMQYHIKPILKGNRYKVSVTSLDKESNVGRAQIIIFKKSYEG